MRLMRPRDPNYNPHADRSLGLGLELGVGLGFTLALALVVGELDPSAPRRVT